MEAPVTRHQKYSPAPVSSFPLLDFLRRASHTLATIRIETTPPSINKTCAYTLREAVADQICAYCALAGPGPSGLQKLIFEHVRSGARLSTVTERTRLQAADLAGGQDLVWHSDPAPPVTQQPGRDQKRQDATLSPCSSGTLKEYITAVRLTDFA